MNPSTVMESAAGIPSLRYEESLGLLRAFKRLEDGQGGIVEILGDPGTGKTKLVAQLTDAAHRAGLTVLDGRCYPSERNDSLHVFSRALNALITPGHLAAVSARHSLVLRAGLCSRHVGDPPPPMHDLARAVHDLLTKSARDGLLLVLDDFHWADPKSLELADHLARWPVQGPVLLVITHRPRQTAPQLLATLAQVAESGRLTRVELAPLTLEQTARLLEVRPDTGWLPAVHKESQGVPLYALVLGESAPMSPVLNSGLLTGRLAPLSAELELLDPAERLVAESGAVLGDIFSQGELSAVSELPLDETCSVVAGLIRHDVLRPLPGSATQFTFRHQVLRRLLHDQAKPCWRPGAHRRALTVLGRRSASAAERAVHIELSTSSFTPEDLEILAKAGEESVVTSPADAVRWLLLALHGLPSAGETHGRLLKLMPPLTRALRGADYLSHHDALRELLTQGCSIDPQEGHRAAIRLCMVVECLQGRFAEADALLSTEIDRLAPLGACDDLLAHLTVHQGIVALLRQDRRLPEVAATALCLARSGGRPTVLAGATALHAMAELVAGRTEQCLVSYDAAVRQVDDLPDAELSLHSEYLALFGWIASALGRPREAESFYERGVSVTQGCAYDPVMPVLLSGLAEAQLRQGRLTSARRSAAQAADLACYLGADQLRTLALAQEALCVTYTEPSGSSRASALAEEALRALRDGSGVWYASAVLTLAEALLLQGSPERALNLLLVLGTPELTALDLPLRARGYELLTLASLSSGTVSDPWAGLAARSAQASGLPQACAYARLARGHVLSRSDTGAALASYQEAERLFDSAHLRLPRLTARFRAARAASAGNRQETAVPLWATVRDLAAQWGVALYARLTPDSLLESSASRGCHALLPAPVPEPASLGLLTERESEVAQLAGLGRRTREIAESLGVSPRTVEVHLSRIYRKLQLGSRAELARLMAVRSSTDAPGGSPVRG
ncbi:AAA family ATPase [Streptomyces sp. NPDC050287]|uniref:AAA family ATPase n=1 Tax=Streptomyces sp. NPDC050287 TaxID=3365608 RepID=UPI0037BCD676